MPGPRSASCRRQKVRLKLIIRAIIRKLHLGLAIYQPACDGCADMGDKSPKATNKKAAQKQANTNSNTQKKGNAAAAKQAGKAKK